MVHWKVSGHNHSQLARENEKQGDRASESYYTASAEVRVDSFPTHNTRKFISRARPVGLYFSILIRLNNNVGVAAPKTRGYETFARDSTI